MISPWEPRADLAERLAVWRHTVTEALLLAGAVMLGAAVVVAGLALLVLVALNAALAAVVLVAAVIVLAWRQGGLISLAGAIWHAADRWQGRYR